MKADFTRNTFDPTKHFSLVLGQQGRVTLDADANEQSTILLRMLRTLARDLIGPYAAPRDGGGFTITSAGQEGLTIAAGRYYVDGILVENETDCLYSEQPDWPLPADDPLAAELKAPTGKIFWLYLDVWERLITFVEDPSLRETALGGPDTAARAKVVWQVKALPVDSTEWTELNRAYGRIGACAAPLENLPSVGDARLTARVDPGQVSDDPCTLSPAAQYRGVENQLYRVEIHLSGAAGAATFKWARDNGSRLAAWVGNGSGANEIAVSDSRGFAAGNWVELSDDVTDLHGVPGTLVRLAKVEPGALTVDPASIPNGANVTWTPQLSNPKVRRWDQVQTGDTLLVDGAVVVREGTADARLWLNLEDGVQIAFSPGGAYRTGDYWMIPARVATGQVEWPSVTDPSGAAVASALPPFGIIHHYAPLGMVRLTSDTFLFEPCRCEFDPISPCFQQASFAVGTRLLRSPLLAVTEAATRAPSRAARAPARSRSR
jgi:hypothetical protein